MKPIYAFIAAFLLASLVGCASGKLQYPGDVQGTERYSPFCQVLDTHSGFTRCNTEEILCYGFSQSNMTCVVKTAAPAPAPAPAASVAAPAAPPVASPTPSPTPTPPPAPEHKKAAKKK